MLKHVEKAGVQKADIVNCKNPNSDPVLVRRGGNTNTHITTPDTDLWITNAIKKLLLSDAVQYVVPENRLQRGKLLHVVG